MICPGLSETAEEYIDLIDYLLPRRAIVLSFRGRGHSDTPPFGYTLDDHVQDIEAVVKSSGLSLFHIFGYSRGVSYALGYARLNSAQLSSIIVEDYPCIHKKMDENWSHDYINHYLIPQNKLSQIREQAVYGIQRESVQEEIYFTFEKPVLVIRGLLEGSLVTDEDIDNYRKQFPNMNVLECYNSGHDIRSSEREILYTAISNFIA